MTALTTSNAEQPPMGELTNRRSGTDRRRGRVSRFLNRRGGFDRRGSYRFLGTLRDAPWTLLTVLILLNVMSAMDGVLTEMELAGGFATEANPVYGHLIGVSPQLAIVVKIGVMLGVSIGIWRWRRYRAIVAIAPLSAGLYSALLAYHLGSLVGLGVI